MKKQYLCRLALLLTFFMLSFVSLYAQNVAINTDGALPNANAILDVKSFNKGILIPRTSTVSRVLIPNTKGMLVYDTTTSSFWYNTGAGWLNMLNIPSWSLNGNNGTRDTSFIGTTDSAALNFRVNNQTSGKIDPILKNAFFGYQAGLANGTGHANVAIGTLAAKNNTTGFNITAVGNSAMNLNRTGKNNTAVGASAGVGTSNLTNTTAIGFEAVANTNNSVVIGNSDVTLLQTAATVVANGGLLASVAGGTINPSAVIEARSDSKGVLLPRLTTNQIFAVSSPAAGLIIYNTTKNKPAYFDGVTWRFFNDSEITLTGTLPNATSVCNYQGVCSITACNTNYSDCDGVAGNGCEVNLMTDINHCGLCSVSGSNLPNVAQASCTGGVLAIVGCNAGFANCDGIVSNGCEVDLMANGNNCGTCGVSVSNLPNVSQASCVNGQTAIISCNAGFANCDGIVSNGCEVNILINPSHCGSCATSVPNLPNVSQVGCSNGQPVIISCYGGFANCDGIVSNGCEVNLLTNSNNCSFCGQACPAGKSCVNGSCQSFLKKP